MAQTPLSSTTPYCSAAVLIQYHDWQQVADLLRDGDSPRPSRSALLDPSSAEGAILLQVLLSASGQLEAACLVGNRYVPADLVALSASNTATKARLEKLVADLAFWALMQRRQPASADPKNCPGALQAIEALDQLRDGKCIFGFAESGDAGLPATATPDLSRRPDAVGNRAARFFGDHGTVNRW